LLREHRQHRVIRRPEDLDAGGGVQRLCVCLGGALASMKSHNSGTRWLSASRAPGLSLFVATKMNGPVIALAPHVGICVYGHLRSQDEASRGVSRSGPPSFGDTFPEDRHGSAGT